MFRPGTTSWERATYAHTFLKSKFKSMQVSHGFLSLLLGQMFIILNWLGGK